MGGEITSFDMSNVLTKKGRMIGSNYSPIIEGCLSWGTEKILFWGKASHAMRRFFLGMYGGEK